MLRTMTGIWITSAACVATMAWGENSTVLRKACPTASSVLKSYSRLFVRYNIHMFARLEYIHCVTKGWIQDF